MIRYEMTSTIVDIDCDLEENIKANEYSLFENDAWVLPIDEFKVKWKVITIRRLGKYYCSAGYENKLFPEKSWAGRNPETLEKLKKYLESLDKEE